MTKLEKHFRLERPLDAALASRVSGTYSIYGMLRVAPEPGGLLVEYDASRLTADDVEAALRRAGVPVANALH